MTDALPSHGMTLRDRLSAAERFMAAGHLDEAGLLLDEARKAAPNDPDVLNAMATHALARGDTSQAAAILPAAATAFPNHAGLVANLGTLRMLEGRLSDAEACLLRAAALAPEGTMHLHTLGLVRLAAGDPDGAEEAANQLLALHPGSAECLGLLGHVALARDDRPAAMRAFRQALRAGSDDPRLLRDLSACHLRDGEPGEALALIERAHLAAPLDLDITEHLALCQAEAGRFAEAEATCRGVLAFAPNHLGLRGLLARIQVADGRAETALAELTPFIRANPRSAEALVALASVAREAGRLGTATPLLAHALTLDPNHATALGLRDEIAFAEGRFPPREDREIPRGTRMKVPRDLPVGEFILLARFLPALADETGRVKLSAAEHHVALAAHLPVELDLAPAGQQEPTLPIGALPRGFALDPDWLGGSKPYLMPAPSRLARWRAALDEHPRPWIGIAWNEDGSGLGMPAIRQALPAGGSVVSLMTGDTRHDLRDWSDAIDAGAHCPDFAELIAAIANLDLVIGPDVAALHLAGALGRPGIVAVAARRPWPWASRDGRSLWYPTIRVVHQSRPGGWNEAVATLTEEIAGIVPIPDREGDPQ